MVPASLTLNKLDLTHPLTEQVVDRLAAQLLAGYGSDAIPLARRRADDLLSCGDTGKFSDWCRVIFALEEIERAGESWAQEI